MSLKVVMLQMDISKLNFDNLGLSETKLVSHLILRCYIVYLPSTCLQGIVVLEVTLCEGDAQYKVVGELFFVMNEHLETIFVSFSIAGVNNIIGNVKCAPRSNTDVFIIDVTNFLKPALGDFPSYIFLCNR